MEENKEKIGFNSDVDIPKEKRKYDKRTKIRKHTTRLMVLSTLVVLGSFSYMFAKVFSILFNSYYNLFTYHIYFRISTCKWWI